MSKKEHFKVEDLLSLFSESISPSDVLTAKLMAQISTAITKERLSLKMNQKQFASHIDASQSLVSRWECGDYNFSIKKLSDIACKLDLDVNICIEHLNTNSCADKTTKVTNNIIQYNPNRKKTKFIVKEELEEM